MIVWTIIILGNLKVIGVSLSFFMYKKMYCLNLSFFQKHGARQDRVLGEPPNWPASEILKKNKNKKKRFEKVTYSRKRFVVQERHLTQ